ncbi:23S rRNA (pseudouridine(1915)-N(3))-methyltransferase RlmH [Polyangium jinanense]|uniref:Ribosomal RNA large subunit methyltransferase H n=1 Tax=Polyangium jinanense TaxID=2829994 RepID=A0A9X4AWE8_9BACT|nr:23S rRNA (pseudouridine(1915)-N(3))-methyltransferase RlmH [Polyangium jinanense]MDC3958754.1 23S rRNA (pseudouridine(1915)-N(3))-methyltransferase RlmH [Polyangium jinanense]MDC3985265.1 23S rRNA (pseudouridine(1915)-N(3))-methyltransferase RlmH [Polyangium jinanense]
MRIVVVAVGRVKDKPLRAALDDYLGRVRRYMPCDEIELEDAPPARLVELFAKKTDGSTTIALEVMGRALDSPSFARTIERAGSRGKGVVSFLIGGADGIPPETSRAAHDRLSLSTLTFPHRLARLVLVEQIYRAMTILRGEPYAH